MAGILPQRAMQGQPQLFGSKHVPSFLCKTLVSEDLSLFHPCLHDQFAHVIFSITILDYSCHTLGCHQ